MPDDALFYEDEDLRGQRFEGIDLSQAEFLDCDLTGAVFVGCTGEDIELKGCDLADAAFERCTLVDVRFLGVGVAGTRWTACKMLSSTFERLVGLGWEMRDSSFMYADMRNLSFEGKQLHGIDLSEANLTHTNFERVTFGESRLRGANWKHATFTGADLRGLDLGPIEDIESIAALRGAILNDAQARQIVGALGLQVID